MGHVFHGRTHFTKTLVLAGIVTVSRVLAKGAGWEGVACEFAFTRDYCLASCSLR